MPPPQAFISSYAPRLRSYANSLLTPVTQPATAQNAPTSRTTKRGTTAINYAEDGFDDDDFLEDSEDRRRPTGLRSLRREDTNQERTPVTDRAGKELRAPVEVQGIWRDWMGKPKFGRTDRMLHAQTALPLTLIPIRIDLDIPAFHPTPALPLPANAAEFGINPSLPAYRMQEATPPFRLKDVFLWNLHETLMTPDQFATILVNDLDLPTPAGTAMQISNQIRQQLEEYAGVALHPLFHSTHSGTAEAKAVRATPSRDASATPGIAASTAVANGTVVTNGHSAAAKRENGVTATAAPFTPSDQHSPDDTYRCIVTLNINLLNKLYTDKFEWSLLHPPGVAEMFSKQTCADMGLAGEWVPAMTHAIYESVLRLKKEACESGGLVFGSGELDSQAADGRDAGWRYDHEQLADGWEPKVETLSKEEIEKREGDRERQIRRLRRETARFSSSTGMQGGVPSATPGGGYFDNPEASETPMGRGERSKKKRRFRSLSPVGRSNTPGRGTPDASTGGGVAGYGGGGGGLSDWFVSLPQRKSPLTGMALGNVRVGGARIAWSGAPASGPCATVRQGRGLCNNCGLIYERDKKLPSWSKELHRGEMPVGR
ncbi:MAG: Chromatin structure remodeling complex protein sfh1 [Thelocarpon impressellum]|nr:MAG: Chromatin structure remodeling complex protein sfh1 [Thelocarpon impressellum]